MYANEDYYREIVDRIGSETLSGNIEWKKVGRGDNSYIADWLGVCLTAEWLKDETHLSIHVNGEGVRIPRIFMNCLHKVIVDQVEPGHAMKQQRREQNDRRSRASTARRERRLLKSVLQLS